MRLVSKEEINNQTRIETLRVLTNELKNKATFDYGIFGPVFFEDEGVPHIFEADDSIKKLYDTQTTEEFINNE